jgi:hypothetical protein
MKILLDSNGVYSESYAKISALQVVYDTLTTQANGTRTPFAGSIIPQDRIRLLGKNWPAIIAA